MYEAEGFTIFNLFSCMNNYVGNSVLHHRLNIILTGNNYIAILFERLCVKYLF